MHLKIDRRQFVPILATTTLGGANSPGSSSPFQLARARNVFSVSMNCYTFGRFDVAQCLDQIRQTPIRNVELPTEQRRPKCLIPELMVEDPVGGAWQYSFPDFKELLARDGFQAESVDVFGYMGYRGSVAIIKRRIDFAHRLGAGTIVLGCEHKALAAGVSASREGDGQQRARAFICGMLRDVAEYGARRNVRIALEIHAGLAVNAEHALRTLREVGHKNLGINFDTANILYYNPGLDAAAEARELELLAKHVFHVHLKDIVRGKPGAGHVLPRLGRGEVHFRRVFDILHNAGFYGPFSFEVETFHGSTGSDDIRDYHRDLVASIDYIRSIGEFEG